jgi:hypothetical protein
MSTDFAHNAVADANRTLKAKTLAAYLYNARMPADVAAALDPQERRAAEREAGVRPCSDETWQQAIDRLRAGWAHYGQTADDEPAAGLAALSASAVPAGEYRCGYGPVAGDRCRRTPATYTRAGWRCEEHHPDRVDQPVEAPGRYCLKVCYCGGCPQWRPIPGNPDVRVPR